MPQTLLLADDSVTIQRVIELTFADEDIEVIAVSDGDEAIARLDASPPNIVLADIGMPGKNGYEVAQYIRQSPHLAHIPVLLLTGAFEPVDQVRAAAAGCDGVLAKPFEPQLVIGRVRELLGRRRPFASPAVPASPAAPALPATAVEPALAPSLRPASPPGELNDYFDRLDAAFANLPNTLALRQEELPTSTFAAAPDAIDWFSTTNPADAPTAEYWDLPAPEPVDVGDLALADTRPPAIVVDPPEPVPAVHERPVTPLSIESLQRDEVPVARPETASPAPAATASFVASPPSPPPPTAPRAVILPPLADAFSALLAAEQGAPPPTMRPTWPASGSSSEVTDDVIDRVVRRVLDRLSDRVIADAVQAAVLPVAERLVREEIERIKSSIK